MFAGLLGLERQSHSSPLLHRSQVQEGPSTPITSHQWDPVFNLRALSWASLISKGGSGRASGSVGCAGRKRLLHRRPGFARGDRRQDGSRDDGDEEEGGDVEEEEEGRGALRNGKSGRHACTADDATAHATDSVDRANKRSLHTDILGSTTSAHSPVNCNGTYDNSKHVMSKSEVRTIPKSPTSETSFNSSFSFIQQSLNCSQDLHTLPEPNLATLSLDQSGHSHNVHSLHRAEKEELWRDGLWSTGTGGVPGSDLPDIDARSVDSDTASASSVTSGYESATPASTEQQGRESLVKKYDQVLQECLQNNRTHTKPECSLWSVFKQCCSLDSRHFSVSLSQIESMMLKLQRLQQKAILEDDYDAAERFGKKLEELCRERGALRLGLPSRQPAVAQFLQRLSAVVNSALQRTDSVAQHRESAESDSSDQGVLSQGPLQRRDRLIQEKRLVELEMCELQQRLSELEQRRRSLEQQIQGQEQEAESEDLETSVLKTYSAPQIRELNQTLQDLLSSQDRTEITVSPPPSVLRLQEQEQALNLSIKEATAKVMMTQRLGSSLRRKVSETETQLLALDEAKLAAISGNDFRSAKQLKAEMKAVYQERDRLEALTRRLQTLSSSSCEELSGLKQQRQQLRQKLEDGQAQHESRLKDNATKYMELLEDRLQSYGCPGLERIWEADLEACHLFLRGLQLRTPSVSGSDHALPPDLSNHIPSRSKADEEEQDCAMLTALGGRWCPEANLQNSEFTKKLEEFLFCVEDNAPEDGGSEAGAGDLTEQCELISDRLMTLEEELQMAIHNRDQPLTQSLEKEVQNVKATLQSMLAQLQKDEEGGDDEMNKLEDDDLMENGLGEEEDEYFSDSWDI